MSKEFNTLRSEASLCNRALSRGQELADTLPRDSVIDALTGVVATNHDRRAFLKLAGVPCLCACAASCVGGLSGLAFGTESPADDARFIVEAQFYEKLPYKKTRCKLCPRECVIDDRERGYCGVRENDGGSYYTLVHSRVCAAHIDPIEKKPFFHFCPGTPAFSVATAGCNVNCKMCQNWDISQSRPEQVRSTYLPAKELANVAQQNRCPIIAYTYSEPVVFYEYLRDAADAGHALGIKSVVVTGAFVQQDPLKKLCQGVDAIKVDLKAFSDKFYKEVVNGELKPVLDALVTMRKLGMWNEIVYLVIPTLNDSDTEFRALAQWIKSDLGVDVPLHFSRFHPEYLLKNLPPTPLETLERAKAIADAEGLHYVYLGNVPGHPAENTYCPKCHRVVIGRIGFTVTEMHLRKGKCEYCQQAIPGVWRS
ncbi:MAG TPA: AmmeMemoRadiSam system radical SAM enzyme [Candidatus Eremiobacteraceae bacterium]|nr:AmmeMemoRadiSam system radical SAM enzyme [Candidatus Eremiobacteraceae bacterium]